MSGLITSVSILLASIFLLPVFYYLPQAVCSAIIIVSAARLIELGDVLFVVRLRAWNDLALLVMTFLVTIFVSIEVGTLISVGMSLLLVINHSSRTRVEVLGKSVTAAGKVFFARAYTRARARDRSSTSRWGCMSLPRASRDA